MSRIANAIIGSNAYGRGNTSPMLDLRYGGQMGFAPELTEWVSNQQYVKRNLICLLVEAPKGFQKLPEQEYWVGTLRALVELHAIRITGLNATLTVETVETPVGGAGQVQQDVTNVTEAKPDISFTWNEKYGMPVQRFLDGWIRYLIMDPNTKFANVNTIAGNSVTDLLADMYSATMCFIEPDPTHTKVVKSWLVSNMYPLTSGEVTAQRDITAASEQTQYDVQFTGISQYGLGVNAFAQKLLDGINITGANPYHRAAFIDSISADVAAMKKSYANGVSTVSSNAVTV